jgi:hypothetical protein
MLPCSLDPWAVKRAVKQMMVAKYAGGLPVPQVGMLVVVQVLRSSQPIRQAELASFHQCSGLLHSWQAAARMRPLVSFRMLNN